MTEGSGCAYAGAAVPGTWGGDRCGGKASPRIMGPPQLLQTRISMPATRRSRSCQDTSVWEVLEVHMLSSRARHWFSFLPLLLLRMPPRQARDRLRGGS